MIKIFYAFFFIIFIIYRHDIKYIYIAANYTNYIIGY